MKSAWLSVLRPCARAVSIPFWQRLTGQRLLLPFYHTAAPDYLPHIDPLYARRTPAMLEADLDWLLARYSPLSLPELLECARQGEQPQRPSFWLSFDDGLSQCYDYIAPLLLSKGVPAAFFINSAFVGNTGLMFRYRAALAVDALRRRPLASLQTALNACSLNLPSNLNALCRTVLSWTYAEQDRIDALLAALEIDHMDYCRKNSVYMNAEQIRSLQRQGFDIGSHSCDHPRYARLDEASQWAQTLNCQDYIDRNFAPALRIFAFPFGDDGVRPEFFARLFDPEQGNFALSLGISGLKLPAPGFPFRLQRIPMEGDRNRSAPSIIHTEYAHFFFKRLLGRHRPK